MTTISMHVHSFAMRFHLRHDPAFDVFRYIELAAEQGFTGVNISANGPGYRDLGGSNAAHYASVRAALRLHDLRCELDTSDTRPEHMTTMLDVAAAVGADTLRTYTRYTGTIYELMASTVRDLRAVAPVAAAQGVTVVLENHEDFQGRAIAEILAAVDHDHIRALFDYGNSMMVGEEPIEALDAMGPFVHSVHAKDHVLVDHDGRCWVQGVPMGQGRLPIRSLTNRLYDDGQRRFCFENVWAYVAPIMVPTERLPDTATFSRDHPHRYRRGEDLPLAAVLAGERAAFDQAWEWWRADLTEAGYQIAQDA